MSKTDLIQAEIQRFLASSSAEVLCIRGKWGVGKTFLWQSELDLARVADKIRLMGYSYVSLFGINNLEALKMSIFENSEYLQLDVEGGGESRINQALGKIKQFRSLLEVIPGVGKVFENAGPLYFATVRNQIICIDDLERRGKDLNITDVLGITSFLKEQRGCKIILLLNDEELLDNASDELARHLEKVVDTNMRFDPDADDSVRIALSATDEITKQLGERCVSLGIANIRVIKRIERTIREVAPLLNKCDAEVLSQAIQTIALLGWVKWQPSLAPSMEYVIGRNADVPASFQKALTPEELSWHATLDSYGFQRMDEFDNELLVTINNGFLNPSVIQKLGEALSLQKISNRRGDSFEASWVPYHEDFSANEKEVLDGMYDAFKPNIGTITPLNLDAVIRLFRELGRNEQADEMVKYYVDNRIADQDFWDLQGDGFGSEVRDSGVIAAFAEKLRFEKIPVDPLEALKILSRGNGWSQDVFDAVAKLTTGDFVEIFKQNKGDELRRLISGALFFGRVANATAAMTEIVDRAKEALIQIGSESALNARRVSRYGIAVPSSNVTAASTNVAAPENHT